MHETVHAITYLNAWKLIVELETETDHNGAEENHQADEFNLEMKEGGSTVGADENHQAHEAVGQMSRGGVLTKKKTNLIFRVYNGQHPICA